MPVEPPVSRRELDQVALTATLAVQMTEVIKDVNELKREMETRFDRHQAEHQEGEARRVSARRFMVGIIVAAVAAVDGPLITLLTVLLTRR